ncbi:globin domain-containing protein [Streptomyces sp. NPDC048196]|uniref:globin domain-containing protein n=1 Tax=Streptomyces sp. NPDC048196 TaxID=3154712 RepID=UPI0033D6858F
MDAPTTTSADSGSSGGSSGDWGWFTPPAKKSSGEQQERQNAQDRQDPGSQDSRPQGGQDRDGQHQEGQDRNAPYGSGGAESGDWHEPNGRGGPNNLDERSYRDERAYQDDRAYQDERAYRGERSGHGELPHRDESDHRGTQDARNASNIPNPPSDRERIPSRPVNPIRPVGTAADRGTEPPQAPQPHREPPNPFGEPDGEYGDPTRPYGDPAPAYRDLSRPYGEPVHRPTQEPIGQPVPESIAQPAPESTRRPAPEPTGQAAADLTRQPAPEAALRRPVESSPRPSVWERGAARGHEPEPVHEAARRTTAAPAPSAAPTHTPSPGNPHRDTASPGITGPSTPTANRPTTNTPHTGNPTTDTPAAPTAPQHPSAPHHSSAPQHSLAALGATVSEGSASPDAILIRRTMAEIGPVADKVTSYFYALLFVQHPDLRALFPASMDTQRDRLFKALLTAATHVDDTEVLTGYLSNLGRGHRKYGTQPDHYPAVGECLLSALSRYATTSWGPETEAAWVRAYTAISQIMIDAAAENEAVAPAWWQAEVVSHELRTPEIAVVTVRPDQPYPFLAGQYTSIETPWWPRVWRHYSFASAPRSDGLLSFHVKAVPAGWVSNAMVHRARPGDVLRLGAPAGSMTVDHTTRNGLLCVGGGTGIAPIKALIEDVADHGIRRPVEVFYGARSDHDLYDLDTMLHLEQTHQWLSVRPVVATGPAVRGGTSSETGQLPDAVRQYGPFREYDAYLSGPPGLIRSGVDALVGVGIPSDRIRHDSVEELVSVGD